MLPNKDALGNALLFDHAYTILHNKMQEGAKNGNIQDAGLFVPVAINCTLSCELFLKAMLPIGTEGHKLYNDLFKKLKELNEPLANSIQDCVIQIMKEKVNDYSQTSFENDLTSHERAFIDWRYFHEGKKSLNFDLQFMYALEACLKQLAIIENSTCPL